MWDLVGNHIVGFLMLRLNYEYCLDFGRNLGSSVSIKVDVVHSENMKSGKGFEF